MFNVPLNPDTSLAGSFDLEALVARCPRHYLVKGMFCNRIATLLAGDFPALMPQLIAPPRAGRYLPFNDYPLADYSRLVVATAAKQFPELALAEATRRLARDDFRTFASSTWGKIAITVIGDPHTALLHMPEAFARVAPGAELRAEESGARAVRMVFSAYRGLPEYMLGQLEGVVLSYDRRPVTTIQQGPGDTLTFHVEHD